MGFLVCHHVYIMTKALYLGNILIVLQEVKAHMSTCTHSHTHVHTKGYAHRHTHTHAQAQGHTDLLFTYAQEHVSVEQAILGGHNNYVVEVSVGVTNFSKVYVFIF